MRPILLIGLGFLILAAIIGCGGGGGNPIQPWDPFTDDPSLDPSDIPHWTPDPQNDREQVQEDVWIRTADDLGLHGIIHRPADSSPTNRYPGLLLIPGGLQAGHAWHARWRKSNAWEFVDAGLIVLVYDARGRGWSGGEEDYNGPVHQSDLRDVIEWFNDREEVVPGGIGIATSSWGITVAAGALAGHPDLEVRFILDLEGAHDRYVMTQWDDPQWLEIMHGHGTWDDDFWKDREAITFIGDVACPYYRIQSSLDHAFDVFYVDHAIAMVNAAVAGESPYVRLNDMTPNQTYDPDKASEYRWYPIDHIDETFYNAVLGAMSFTTELN